MSGTEDKKPPNENMHIPTQAENPAMLVKAPNTTQKKSNTKRKNKRRGAGVKKPPHIFFW